jgi:hypothetical protein
VRATQCSASGNTSCVMRTCVHSSAWKDMQGLSCTRKGETYSTENKVSRGTHMHVALGYNRVRHLEELWLGPVLRFSLATLGFPYSVFLFFGS